MARSATIGPFLFFADGRRGRIKLLSIGVIVLSLVVPMWLAHDHAWLPWLFAGIAVIAIIVVLRMPGAGSGSDTGPTRAGR